MSFCIYSLIYSIYTLNFEITLLIVIQLYNYSISSNYQHRNGLQNILETFFLLQLPPTTMVMVDVSSQPSEDIPTAK